ncbi:hypothetical protein PV08_11915 [Exophiala spinifera]|uniref:Uncharacterized protein n=1 Tax=Exophiala spinifera TaxID=91928 RepID=A0A0D2BEJ7_9EURO|nr:uncharacterized protein PV08_11915 [Exophiala spinifera]KIW09814.1 hypothetical protein PV08_11915 [Exophiala spinifera]
MRTVKKLLSPLLSCFGVHSHEDEYEASDLKSLPHPASASSISLPANTVPHSVDHSGSHAADTDALRQIFRSSSSVRGYQTASRRHERSRPRESSFDADFKFGAGHSDDHKQPGRIEQFGKHIRQKMSESRLSKSSSRMQGESEDAGRLAKLPQPMPLEVEHHEAALSQRSTGLLELLMSGSGSQGGYDSDAKSIQSTMLKCSDGTLKLSPKAAEVLLRTPSEKSSIKHDLVRSSPTKPTARSALGCTSPSTPSGSLLFLDGQTDSTNKPPEQSDDVFNDGVVDLPRLHACATTELDSVNLEAPNLDLHKDEDAPGFQKRMSDIIDVGKGASGVSTADHNRSSLVSNLDTSLINAIAHFGEPGSAEIAASGEERPGVTLDQANPATGVASSSRTAMIPSKDDGSGRDVACVDESDCNSIHLFNMRISQRLASPSFVAGSSRPDTSHTTTNLSNENSIEHCPHLSSPSSNTAGTTTSEHNRLPSDPQTKRLFENETTGDTQRQVWRPSTSSTYLSQYGGRRPIVSRGEASSCYCSDDEDGELDERNGSLPRRNPNSIAIGGRSESMSLPLRSTNPSMSHFTLPEERAWFGRLSLQQQRGAIDEQKLGRLISRHRSVSMPDKTAEGRITGPTIAARQQKDSTEADEALSEISYGKLQDARREQLTEISAQEAQDSFNERLSEIEVPQKDMLVRSESRSGAHCLPLWSSSRQCSTASDVPLDGRCDKPTLHESTTDIWRRTLKRALDEPADYPMGTFLTAPKFDRDGRRRSVRSSLGNSNSNPDIPAHPSAAPKRAVNALRSRQRLSVSEEIPRDNPERHHEGILPKRSIAFKETRPAAEALSIEKNRKKSLLDFGKRFAIPSSADDEPGSLSSSTPLKDLFGAWSRFPSHTRNERCGPAGTNDGVIVRDFAEGVSYDVDAPNSTPETAWDGSLTSRGMQTPRGSLKLLYFGRKSRMDKGKTRSMPLPRTIDQSPAFRAKKSRRGLVGKWKKIYRSSSSDLKVYIGQYGHRSSISLGLKAKNPDLESIPGLDHFRGHSDSDAAKDGHKCEATTPMTKGEATPLNFEPWTQVYKDCVGSLSALRSDADIGSMSEWTDQVCEGNETLHRLLSTELRDSTTNFETQPGKELETARKGLLRKIENSSQGHRLEVPKIHLKQD